jgi:hypothetical protein
MKDMEMLFGNLFKKPQKAEEEDVPQEPTINQGIYYLYLIIGLQVFFVLALASIIMVVGKVMATPMWVFLFAFSLCVGGGYYIYRKAKRQFQKFRDTFNRTDLSNRNYEISFMGGVVTMRVEQAQRPLLEAPQPNVVDAKTVEGETVR